MKNVLFGGSLPLNWNLANLLDELRPFGVLPLARLIRPKSLKCVDVIALNDVLCENFVIIEGSGEPLDFNKHHKQWVENLGPLGILRTGGKQGCSTFVVHLYK